MMRLMAPLFAVLAASGPAFAQDSPWVETKFHRVHLRNGNFIDGKLIGVRDQDVELMMPIGDMIIRKDTIDRIELMKIRSFNEKPKLDPPLKKSAPAPGAVKAARPVWRASVLPMLDDNTRLNLEAIFSRFKIATREQRLELIKDMARQETAAPYLAARLPSLDEDLGLAVREALILMKDPDANPYLVSALECDRLFARIQAVDILGEVGKPENCAALRRCLQDEVAMVRVAAMAALTRLSDPDTLEKLVELFLDENAEIRSAALSHALNLGRKVQRVEAVQEGLRRALLEARGAVAGELSWAAARTGKKELWPAIAAHLRAPEAAVRGAAVEALGALEAPESVESVVHQIRIEDDKGVMLRLAATAWKLKSLDTVPLLIEWLRNNDTDIATAASRALFGMTRQGFGSSYDKWSDWWESVRPR